MVTDQLGKIKRGGYVFMTWIGDHPPRHVHVFRDDKHIVKWDLDGQRELEGMITGRIKRLIDELEAEGRL